MGDGTVQECNTDKTLYVSDVFHDTISEGRSKISGSPIVGNDDPSSGCRKHSGMVNNSAQTQAIFHLLLLSAELDSSSTMHS